MTDWIEFTRNRLGVALKKVGRTEYAGSCPWCGGHDRFHCFERGWYFCRPGPGHCARSGWLDELSEAAPLTEAERTAMRLTALERKMADHEARLSALEQIRQCTDHVEYHENLNYHPEAVDYWLAEGCNPQTIHDFQLGYCGSCPTLPGYASYTIPVTYRRQLYNIRHRICKPPATGGKYRPHMAGLPSMIFNADALDAVVPDRMLLLEGEKKVMVVCQETGLNVIGTMGAQSFKQEWAGKLAAFGTVYVCYDPDATEKARQVAALFGKRGRVMNLPVKADDLFTRHHGDAHDFLDYLNKARPV